MNTALPDSPPQQLLRRLRDDGDNPVVPEAERPQAIAWLRCVLVDFSALNTHIALLQQLHGDAPFCLPGPRRDGAAPSAPPPDARFRFREVWPNEQIVPILDGGLEVLKNEELARLLLNPYALADLHDVISEVEPDAWLPVIEEVGREMMRRDGIRQQKIPPPPRLLPGGRSTTPGTANATRAWRWAALSSLAAAAVLLVALIGVLRTYPPRGDSGTNLVVSATPRFGDRKGGDRTLTGLEVTSNFDGHVTVVFLEPNNRQVVLPLPGSEQEWRVAGSGSPTTVVVPDRAEDATAALVVVTETPADAPIRKLLDRRFTADQIDEVQSLLQAKLRDLNYKRFRITPIKIAPAKGS